MPSESIAPSGPDKLSLIVFSSDFERIHYALAMASSAAAVGGSATLFFTMGGLLALRSPFPNAGPAWRTLPAADGRSGGEVDDTYVARGIANFEELLAACAEMSVRMIVCEMGLRAMGLDRSALRSDLPIEEAGIVTFLGDASRTGAIIFI
jgi:peroxiredoxin family protein